MALRAYSTGPMLIKAEMEFIINLFTSLAEAANDLHGRPRFCRTMSDNCTTNLARHIERIYTKCISFRYETLLPAKTGRLLYDMGYMDTTLGYPQTLARFKMDDKTENTPMALLSRGQFAGSLINGP